jgi:hypothetical protein
VAISAADPSDVAPSSATASAAADKATVMRPFLFTISSSFVSTPEPSL